MAVAPANTSSIIVAITGVLQDPSTYSVSGTTLTFSAAPPTGTSNISVRYLGIPASGVTTTAYRTVTNFTATAGQTSFSTPSYTVGYIDVFRNGVRLVSTDFTATTGTTVVLNNGCTAGDTVTTESFYVSSVLNAIPATNASINQSYLALGVAGTGPAFRVYLSTNQTVTAGVNTKITLNTDIVKDKKRQTCLIKYGVDNFTKTDDFKIKFEVTCLLKYGVSHHLKLDNFMDKTIETNKMKYGVRFFTQTEDWLLKSKITRIKNGNQIPDYLKTPFELYRHKVDLLTKKNKQELFSKWDGNDYYDGEYIKGYIELEPTNKLYPTIDHKVSVFNGFINNTPIEEISKMENLCITKRSINSKKHNRNESNFEV
jgi:hypothetical protein